MELQAYLNINTDKIGHLQVNVSTLTEAVNKNNNDIKATNQNISDLICEMKVLAKGFKVIKSWLTNDMPNLLFNQQ
jgi:hypothetical protein